MSSLKIFRTSKTRVSSLPSFNSVRPKPNESEVRKREVTVVESGLDDIFGDLYEKPKTEAKADEISAISYKSEIEPKLREDEVTKEKVVVEESGLGDIFEDLYGESETGGKPVQISATLHAEDEKTNTNEGELRKEKVVLEESGLGDIFQDLYGESGTEVKPGEIPATSASKSHVRPDGEAEDRFLKQDEPQKKKQYYGMKVQEGVNSTKSAEVENSDLDDLISQVMDIPADENPKSSSPKPHTSTPTKDYGDDADFGDALSLIRGDDEGPEVPAGKANQRGTEEDKNRNRRSEGRDETSRKPMAYRDSFKVRGMYPQ